MINISLANKGIFTGLEIEGGYVKLAQAQDFAGARKITKIITKKLASQSENDIVATLKGILGELKGQIGHLTLCIPRHKVTVRFLKFPSVNEKEIAGMVKLQSAKELPLAKEEIISDYLITERTKDGYARVALAIVHKDVIDSYLDILKKAAAFEPERVTFSTEAVLNWQRVAYKQKSVKSSLILIDVDINNADIVIFDNSSLGFTRGLAWGSEQLHKQPDLKHKLADEIKRTIEGYTRQEGVKKIEKIFLGQAGKTIVGLKTFLQQELNLPCQIFSPLENLSCQKEISSFQYSLELSLLRILGMALSNKQSKLNLLPSDLREKQKFNLKRRRLYTTLGLLIGIALLSLAALLKEIHNKQLYIFYLDEEIKKTAPKAKEVEDMLKKIELIETRSEILGSSIDVLRELHNVVPPDISLSTFTYDENNKTAILQGVSTNMSEIFKFIKVLEESIYFRNVQLKYVSGKKTEEANFKIECSLEK